MGIFWSLVASVLPQLENQGEDKHVESILVPRLDESSNLSSSTEQVSDETNKTLKDLTLSLHPKTQVFLMTSTLRLPKFRITSKIMCVTIIN